MLLVFDVIQRLSTPLCIHQRRYIRVLWKKLSTCKFRCLTKCIEWSPYILTFDMSSHELAVTKIRRSEILFFWWKTGTPRFVTVHKNLDGLPVNMVANHFWWCDPNSIQTRNVANLLVVCFLSLSLSGLFGIWLIQIDFFPQRKVTENVYENSPSSITFVQMHH